MGKLVHVMTTRKRRTRRCPVLLLHSMYHLAGLVSTIQQTRNKSAKSNCISCAYNFPCMAFSLGSYQMMKVACCHYYIIIFQHAPLCSWLAFKAECRRLHSKWIATAKHEVTQAGWQRRRASLPAHLFSGFQFVMCGVPEHF